ncbi:MAG: Nramp family divalent metal transporter, partial [Oceanobacter sp.]
MLKRLRKVGPGAMVAAAFIGPGTVTTASVAGAQFGTALLWAVVFSIIATLVMQEMSARLGIVSRMSLGEALRSRFSNPAARLVVALLVIGAIGVGAAAYESGNILGGASGLETLTGVSVRVWAIAMGAVAAVLLWIGRYQALEKVLVALVGLMALCFLSSAILVRPPLFEILQGLVPKAEENSLWLVTGLIGTTVVGYNLFLHSASVRARWGGPEDLSECRFDLTFSILVGGIVTMAILLTAAAVFPLGTQINNVATMVTQIEPVAGEYARVLFSLGLFTAGFTSAITAPLAAAYATA